MLLRYLLRFLLPFSRTVVVVVVVVVAAVAVAAVVVAPVRTVTSLPFQNRFRLSFRVVAVTCNVVFVIVSLFLVGFRGERC